VLAQNQNLTVNVQKPLLRPIILQRRLYIRFLHPDFLLCGVAATGALFRNGFVAQGQALLKNELSGGTPGLSFMAARSGQSGRCRWWR
jgi:hypothetical protein